MFFFDYIFFRIHLRAKVKNKPAPIADGTIFVTLLQIANILDVMYIVRIFHWYEFPGLFYWFFPIVGILASVNWIRYRNFFDLERPEIARWKSEPSNQIVRNVLIIGLYSALSFLIPPMVHFLLN